MNKFNFDDEIVIETCWFVRAMINSIPIKGEKMWLTMNWLPKTATVAKKTKRGEKKRRYRLESEWMKFQAMSKVGRKKSKQENHLVIFCTFLQHQLQRLKDNRLTTMLGTLFIAEKSYVGNAKNSFSLFFPVNKILNLKLRKWYCQRKCNTWNERKQYLLYWISFPSLVHARALMTHMRCAGRKCESFDDFQFILILFFSF